MIDTNKARRGTATFASLFLAASIAGCSGGSGQNENASTGGGGTQQAPDKIVFWHYLNDRHDLLVGMANDFKAKTGIQVDVQLFGGDGFKQKIIASAQTNALPDVMTYSGGAGDLAKLVETKSVMELGGKMAETFKKFPESVVKTYSYGEGNAHGVKAHGTYAVPMDTNNMQYIYNKDLFAKAGIAEPPQTWEQFLQTIDKLRAAGITPLATGIGSWVIGPMAAPYEFAYLGKEKLLRVKQGKEPLIGSGYEKVLKTFEDLQKHKAFADGISTMDLPKAEQMFVNGETAMLFDGSWAIGVFNQMNPNFKNYGVFLPPKPADASHDIKITGGIGVPLVVSQNAKNADAALKFVEFLVAKEQQQKYAEKSFNLPANMEAAQTGGDMSPALRSFTLGMRHVYDDGGIYPSPNVDTVMQKGVQLIVLGQSTPDKVLKQMDDALQKALKDKK